VKKPKIVPPIAEKKEFEGNIYIQNGRYYWKVAKPGESKRQTIPLRPPGAKYATKDLAVAEILAGELWDSWQPKQAGPVIKRDRKLSTLINAYERFAHGYYRRKDGSNSAQYYTIYNACRFLKAYHNDSPNDFGPLRLKQIQQSMINEGLARKTINTYIGIIKAMYKWGVSEERVEPVVYYGLAAVENLKKGRSAAKEPKKIRAVDPEHVRAIYPFTSPTIAAMIELQMLTGMRSTELCLLRPCDMTERDGILIYVPEKYKTEHLDGAPRLVPIGPRGQAAIFPLLRRFCPLTCPEGQSRRNLSEYVFSPKEADIEWRARKLAMRKTPLSCGNKPGSNKKEHPQVVPGDCYDKDSYRKAIDRAIKAAQKSGVVASRFHPHQIRHTAGTLARRHFDMDTVKAMLGHRHVNTTEIYAELDLMKAVEVAKKMG